MCVKNVYDSPSTLFTVSYVAFVANESAHYSSALLL